MLKGVVVWVASVRVEVKVTGEVREMETAAVTLPLL